jgi:uracil-DNA glycosylase family 4
MAYEQRPVHGEGREPNDYMLVGSEPGWKEMQRGRPFVGPTGEEVDRLLSLIHFPRPFWFVTNYFRRPAPRVDGKSLPHPGEDFEEAGHNLKEELRRVRPRLIVPLGREAIRYFLGDVDVDEVWGLHLKPPADVLERLDMLRPDVTIAPQVHPAAGFHSPEANNQVLVGFELLGRILRGKTPARYLHDDPIPEPTYYEIETPKEFYEWCDALAEVEVANDTEGSPRFPWSIQLTKRDGEGILLRKAEVIRAYVEWAKRVKPRMTFHHALHDVRMNRVMGLDVFEEGIPFDDTMIMAYELGVIPQGLKSLAVRECAMPMLDYMDVLGDAQDRHARQHVQHIWDVCNTEYQRLRKMDFEFQKNVLGRRIKVLPKLPKSKLMASCERVLGSKEPARLWLDQVEDRHTEAYALVRCEMPEASLSDVDPSTALYYAGRDPDATRRLKKVLLPRVQDMGLENVYRLDLSTYPIIDRMMQMGITPDHKAFAELAQVLDEVLEEVKDGLVAATGILDFNPNSGDQTADYLFDTLGLEMLGKKTSAGRGTTGDKVLEGLEKMYPEYPQIADLRAYRQLYKLRWTFVEQLPELVKRWPFDGRIHCELMLNRTPSGRLAAKSPNLLAMPKHDKNAIARKRKLAKMFRRCFVARPECLLLSLDESQIELRVGAHLSGDPVMCAIYRGERRNPDGSMIDLHANMVHRVYGTFGDNQTNEQRTACKAINFGFWMGQTYVGLKLELQKAGLDVSDDDAQRMIDEANDLYKGAQVFKDAMIEEAHRHGYIRCPLSGRIRYVGGIRSRDDRVRAEAERFAYSTPIQEGAQAIGKHVLASAWDNVYVPRRRRGEYVEPLLWTHDDLLSEVHQNHVLAVARELKAIMTEAPAGFSVPLDTKPEAGLNWADMVEL